jgi:hypothetical protein
MFSQLQYNHYSSRERLFLIKLDDCNILKRDHLVKNRPSLECMIHPALKTSVSHGSVHLSVRLMAA